MEEKSLQLDDESCGDDNVDVLNDIVVWWWWLCSSHHPSDYPHKHVDE